MGIKVAASLLSADFSRLWDEVKRVEDDGVDIIHWDVMDGHFVPNISMGPRVIQSLRDKTKLPFYIHLMIEAPDRFLDTFVDAGGDAIFVHAEACPHLQRTVRGIKDLGVKAGVALNPATPLGAVDQVLEDLDSLLIMTVNPGFGGQKFIPAMLPKIREAKRMVDERGLDVDIGVDGGIDEETAPLTVEAGANLLVIGSAIYGKKGLSVKRLKERLAR
mgnify:CR=1 FL=1